MKIGILNQKGGAGKTTIALHLAHSVVELIEEAQIYKPNLQAKFIINRKIVNTAICRRQHCVVCLSAGAERSPKKQ